MIPRRFRTSAVQLRISCMRLVRPTIALFFFVTTVICAAFSPLHAEWDGDLNVVLGAKLLDDVWKPVDSQPSFGLMADARQSDWPLNLAVDANDSCT